MAEENLSEALAQIRLDNEKNTNQAMELGLTNQAILSSQQGTKIAIDQLTATFKQFFKAERRDKEGDDLEASREAPGQVSKEGAMGAATGSDIDKLDFTGNYVAMIAGAIAGLSRGLIGGLVKQISFVTKSIGKLFRVDKALAALKNSSKLFQARFMKLNPEVGKFFKAISSTFTNITKQFKAGFEGLKIARNSVGQFTKLNIFAKFGSFFRTLLKPFIFIGKTFASLFKIIKSAFGVIRTGGSFISSFFSTFGSFFRTFALIGSKLLIPLQVVIGVVSGAIQAFKDASGTAGGFLDKLIAGVGGFVKGAFNALISMPLDLLKSGVSFIASKLGFENFAELIDSFSFTDLFSSMFDGITSFVTGVKDIIVGIFTFDGDTIKKGLGSIGGILAGIGKFFVAVAAGGLAALGALLPGGESPGEAFVRKYKEVMATGSDNKGSSAGGTGAQDIEPNNLNRADAQETLSADAQRKESRSGTTVVVDNSTNTNTSTSGDTLAMSGGPEPAVNPRKKSRSG